MSDHFRVFPYVWLTIVATIGAVSLAKGIYELNKGEARSRMFGGYSDSVSKDDQPFYYWLIIGGDFAGVLVTAFMFWMGRDMLSWG